MGDVRGQRKKSGAGDFLDAIIWNDLAGNRNI